ncbi:23S rRNA methyltransferase [Sulfurifustis variabilis]|uniref:23S rRNA (guanosine-2'-O-)-methyltransferase RlmB n=1 Tax=Sulfurifustis variabilis TaxID=1675686 RepID=A0A1B4V4L3_9GAMM|nr:23S rRNA (guanosine(2251)-2'-O)-methyltransferase RlmB [Sulfurifustis variabilis]BAU48473.1 23S rRNA methyltransferase [Sulfurifustis variabilis]
MSEDFIVGLHAVLTALRQRPERISGVWVNEERIDKRVQGVLDAARDAGVKFHRVPRAKLDEMARGLRHQGAVARVRLAPAAGEAGLAAYVAGLRGPALMLVLDGVQDPHNLGACLRVADAAGCAGVVLPRDRAAPVSAVARRAASGAAESVKLFQVVNLARAMRDLREAGFWLIGATQDAPDELYEVDLTGRVALVLGGEGQGLRRLTREHCDRLIRIPMAGAVESLNVSVAAGVCLYEAVRQRRDPRDPAA